MPRRLPTPDQFIRYLVDKCGCKHESLSVKDPTTGVIVHGGRITRTVAGDKPGTVRESIYANDTLGPKVSAYMIGKICGPLAITQDEVLDYFDGALSN